MAGRQLVDWLLEPYPEMGRLEEEEQAERKMGLHEGHGTFEVLFNYKGLALRRDHP